jgi:arylsulfatase
VLYIVIDDMGYADIGCYGSRIKTPNIDALAEDGLRYSNFHVNAMCSPTRASLLSGCNHHNIWDGGISAETIWASPDTGRRRQKNTDLISGGAR